MKNLLARLKLKLHEPQNAEGDASELGAMRPKRKSQVPLWRRRSTVALAVVTVVSLAGGASTWAVKTGLVNETYTHAKWNVIKTSADHGFTVQDVLVTGRGETDREALLQALGIARGAPILAFDFEAAKARVETLPWVLQARIERLLPDTVAVHLIERRPIALWQFEGQFALIDEEGSVITRNELSRFTGLIHVVGEDAPNHVGGLLELLETQPQLKSQVSAAVRVGGRRWDLMLAGGVDVRLPETGAPDALARLADFEQETGVLGREIRVLDLRVPDRVIVGRKETHRPKTPATKPGQET